MLDFLYTWQPVIQLVIMVIIAVPTMQALIKGAPFVPTPYAAVRKMLKMAHIKPGDKVYDIGCGDGRLVHLATKEHKAKGFGIELSPMVYVWARIRKWWWKSTAQIRFANFWRCNLKDADVVVCYLMPNMMDRVVKKLSQELKPGARVVSYAFKIPAWEPVRSDVKDVKKRISSVWVYEM